MPTTQRPDGAYNPLDKHNLGTNVGDALLARPVVSLPPPAFPGAGVLPDNEDDADAIMQLLARLASMRAVQERFQALFEMQPACEHQRRSRNLAETLGSGDS